MIASARRIAARFFARSADTQIFKRGEDAHNHPDFYHQLRQDPAQMRADALQLLAKKFNLPGHDRCMPVFVVRPLFEQSMGAAGEFLGQTPTSS